MIVNPELGAESLVIPRTEKQKEMISVRVEGGQTVVRINSSSLLVLQECFRKAQYSLEQGWTSQSESPATVFGTAIHSALEVFYSGGIGERRLPKLDQMELMGYGTKVTGEETDLLLRATRAFIEKAQPLRPLPETDKRSIQNGVWILHEYFKKFIDTPYVAYVDEAGPFVERTFTLRIVDTPDLAIDVFGTIDFVFKNTVTGELIPGDHKTSSALTFKDSSYFDRDKPNHQYTIYSMAAQRVFGLTTEDFLVSIIEVKAKPKTARGSGPSFPVQATKRTEEDYEEVKEVIVDAVLRYLIARDSGLWPMGPVSSCNTYGGCQYKQVCAAPKVLRETILKAKFNRTGEMNETI